MDKNELTTFVDQWFSTREISKKTGKSQTTVRYWLKRYQLKTKPAPRNRGGENSKPEAYQKPCCCKFCGASDPKDFYEVGRKRIKTRCRKCHAKEQVNRFREYKRLAVEYKGGKCIKCGYDKCLACLDFHHPDPSQKDPRWRMMRNWTFENVKCELDKCWLVCRNCHGEIHYGTNIGQ